MESFIFLVEWRLVLTISFGKSNPWNHKMAQQVNVGISSQTVSAPQQQQQQKTALSSLCCPCGMIFFLLRVLLTNIAITVFHVRNSECLNKASLKALQRTLSSSHLKKDLWRERPESPREPGCCQHSLLTSALPVLCLPLPGLEFASLCTDWPVGALKMTFRK